MINKMKKCLIFCLTAAMLIGALPAMSIPVFGTEVSGNDMLSLAVSEETCGLNYIYLENPYIEAPTLQHVVVSYGDENVKIAQAELTVQNYDTGSEKKYTLSDTYENTAKFELAYLPEDKGIYKITDLTVITTEGYRENIHLADVGMEQVYFGVNQVVEEPSLLAEEEEDLSLSQLQMQVITLEADSRTITKNDIDALTETIEAAAYNAEKGARALYEEEDAVSRKRDMVVVLDPGHDSTHAGAYKNGLREEVLNLKIAQYCKAELEQYKRVKVYMTRESAACPYPGSSAVTDNRSRVNMAAGVGADIYVSIHLNSAGTSKPSGAEVFYPNSSYRPDIGSQGANLATQIQRQIVALGLKNNGISIRNSGDGSRYPDGSLADYYAVIKHSKNSGFPGVIIEHAYVSNGSDAAFLKNEANIQALGIADATGIANYLGLSKTPTLVADPEKVKGFVTRLYQKCLGREPDQAGLEYWVNNICEGEKTGVEAAFGFFFSKEIKEAGLSNEEFVEILYNVLLDRKSDEGGKKDWLYKLENGASRYGIFIGFANSIEFDALCLGYGIDRGNAEAMEPRDKNLGLTGFICRLYTKALGREYDLDGLNTWCDRVIKKEWTITDVSTTGFFNSQEFINKNLSDEDYVKVLYETFFDRKSDETGFNYWIDELKKGKTRDEVIKGFADSVEFANLKKAYNL